ncbi:MAG: lysine--tRNA ligase [Acidobacteriota bacterium]|nr:lysine--tRNA ligase [Acidobacteriota bacterium]
MTRVSTEAALESSAWPFAEARKIVTRFDGKVPERGFSLLETGYGPSGLPHIGTFAEVARTTMVLRALGMISDIPARLVCFSDDMDGLRRVPTNVPNQELLAEHLGKPLTCVPDPFGTHSSFGEHNNARLRSFLDDYGFDYEFRSATEGYKSGDFDDALLAILRHFDAIQNVVLPTLGEERRQTYAPFLPICQKTGVVLQVPLIDRDTEAGTVTFDDADGDRQTVPVTGGHVKCQWKVDWAMRWHALGVDYEMCGKDLIESVKLSSRIQRILGTQPPEGLIFELFLDDKGERISKSRGNGLAIEDWLAYASPESLSWYMYQSPKRAKRLYFDVIPRAVDDYYSALNRYSDEDQDKQLQSAVFHIHGGDPPVVNMPIAFSMLLNLVSAAHATDKQRLWGFVARYLPGTSAESHPELDHILDYAVRYYKDFVGPNQDYRAPDEREAAAMSELVARLKALPADADAEALQHEVYEAGKTQDFDNLRDWFRGLYECLLGHSQGPRMGGFIALYGVEATIVLLEEALARANG